jgi:hypothetical protein
VVQDVEGGPAVHSRVEDGGCFGRVRWADGTAGECSVASLLICGLHARSAWWSKPGLFCRRAGTRFEVQELCAQCRNKKAHVPEPEYRLSSPGRNRRRGTYRWLHGGEGIGWRVGCGGRGEGCGWSVGCGRLFLVAVMGEMSCQDSLSVSVEPESAPPHALPLLKCHRAFG